MTNSRLKGNESRQIHVWVPLTQHRQLKVQAAIADMTLNDMVVLCLAESLANTTACALRGVGQPTKATRRMKDDL